MLMKRDAGAVETSCTSALRISTPASTSSAVPCRHPVRHRVLRRPYVRPCWPTYRGRARVRAHGTWRSRMARVVVVGNVSSSVHASLVMRPSNRASVDATNGVRSRRCSKNAHQNASACSASAYAASTLLRRRALALPDPCCGAAHRASRVACGARTKLRLLWRREDGKVADHNALQAEKAAPHTAMRVCAQVSSVVGPRARVAHTSWRRGRGSAAACCT